MVIKKSSPNLHKEFSEITKLSKNFWNYPDDWMRLWREDLIVTEKYIRENNVFHIENDAHEILGFYSYFYEDENIRLEHLFIEPNSIGKGIGKVLINDFFERIKDLKFDKIILDADPNAENFYLKYGFETIEMKPTKI